MTYQTSQRVYKLIIFGSSSRSWVPGDSSMTENAQMNPSDISVLDRVMMEEGSIQQTKVILKAFHFLLAIKNYPIQELNRRLLRALYG